MKEQISQHKYLARVLLFVLNCFVIVGCSPKLSDTSISIDPKVGGPESPGLSTARHGAIDAMSPELLLENSFDFVADGEGQKYIFTIDFKNRTVAGSIKDPENIKTGSYKAVSSQEDLQAIMSQQTDPLQEKGLIGDDFWQGFNEAVSNARYYSEEEIEQCRAKNLQGFEILQSNKNFPSIIREPGIDGCHILDLSRLATILAVYFKAYITQMDQPNLCVSETVLSRYEAIYDGRRSVIDLSSGRDCVPTWPNDFGFKSILSARPKSANPM